MCCNFYMDLDCVKGSRYLLIDLRLIFVSHKYKIFLAIRGWGATAPSNPSAVEGGHINLLKHFVSRNIVIIHLQ
jgi:hypothetical protein